MEIGIIGYVSQRPILDTMGLVSPDMTRRQSGWTESVVYAVIAYQPQFVVATPGSAWDLIDGSWWFSAQYKPAARFDDVTIYRRRSAAVALRRAPVEVNYANGLALTGMRVASTTLEPGEELELWLEAAVGASPLSRVGMALELVDAQTYETYGDASGEPFDGYYGSQHWQTGDQLAIPLRLDVPADLEPGAYRLGVRIFEVEGGAALPLRGQAGASDPDVRVGWFRLGSPSPSMEWPDLEELSRRVQWEGGIDLAGMGLPSQPVAPGGALPVRLAWRPSAPIGRDLTTFLHLVDEGGEIVAQKDRPPFHRRWPTPVWRPGELLVDTFELEIPEALPGGSYGLRLGWYDAQGRMPLAGGSADHWLEAGVVEVREER
jgi:hypothetical protein